MHLEIIETNNHIARKYIYKQEFKSINQIKQFYKWEINNAFKSDAIWNTFAYAVYKTGKKYLLAKSSILATEPNRITERIYL